MNTFVNAVKNVNNETTTTNGMKAYKSTFNDCVDLFYNIGGSRGKDIIPQFKKAYAADPETATRIALWARDVRGGAGERQLFRDIFKHLSEVNDDFAKRVLKRIPELGRWDDVLVTDNEEILVQAFDMIREALAKSNGLCAKWMPRKGERAVRLRNYLGMTPKQYRKTLVGLTDVVEQKMCANEWEAIDFNKLPSLASARYKKAFERHTGNYKEWTAALEKNDGTAKVNAGAIFPYDVIKDIRSASPSQRQHIAAQWDALPDYATDTNVLTVVDVSGSMGCPAGGYGSGSTVTCLDVAVSLGLYFADKNKGAFKDMFVTFSTEPDFQILRGKNIVEKMVQMAQSQWHMSTDIEKVFKKLLSMSIQNNVLASDMPSVILIISDMQFNSCVRGDNLSAMQMIRKEYEAAGYEVPNVVFWNVNASGNVPVSNTQTGAALVSGFSPAIAKAILGGAEEFTPVGIMMNAIGSERYNF